MGKIAVTITGNCNFFKRIVEICLYRQKDIYELKLKIMRTLKISFFLVVALLLTTLSSCEKDEPTTKEPSGETYSFETGAAKSASFFGTIVDENNNTMSGVAISIGSSSAVTDANGVFFIEDANVHENLAYVKAEKNGYFLGSRSLVPTDEVNKVKIMLLAKQNIGSVDASVGGTVSGNGITIEFEDGFVNENGSPYTGTVNVAAKYIDPESTDFYDYMPGNLIGANSNGGQYLESYGMVAIELTDGSGSELQPADGKTAAVSFPLSAGLMADAPNSIPLWHFDETRGYWVIEGSATLDGNVYKANVSHFSFWNCDIPTDYIVLDGQVVEGGAGVPGITVKIVSTGFGTGQAFTDGNGEFGGIVPANNNLTLEVYFDCGAGLVLIHSQVLGSFASDVTIPAVGISTAGTTVNVSGTVVDCAYNAVSNGYILYGGNKVAYLSGGNFDVLSCTGATLDIQGFDLDNLTESGVSTYTLGLVPLNVGQIVACNSLTEYIQWNVDGTGYLASSNLYFYDQGGFAGINGDTPNSFSIELFSFAGVGSYTIDNNGSGYITAAGVDSISSAAITVDITQFGSNPGDLIEGTIGGSVQDNLGNTLPISGDIHMFKN